MKWLIKVVETYVVPTVAEVENLHEEFLQDNHYQLTGYSYKTKEVKSKGEVIDEYQVVTATKIFNQEKEPCYDCGVYYEDATDVRNKEARF